jgi:glycosyltransferase involved in cell wall biosynthesis
MLRKWDSKPRTYDKVISNSRYTQQQAKKIYNIDTIIQYPQIHEKILKTESNVEHHNYFIYTGRLVTFVKEVDKIIQACNQTQTPLIIMGDGPDKEKLQYIAGETIIFLPRIHDINQRIQLIQ